ncbi:16S rRNA (guanine966-N2)-methyltransferase [Acetitomaculum ruminis DSM 5522]|uniref:16S rRNA (Guanine966-N2)-methyltransferase n=1 Tax=Acetitomaculum ruminis DSM 5522 TaxID=1120918 RepID=A0A1I0V908_9FIRM|nr:16S rRNA (guanine(966)-N(2))-methyltransferase RsmD [Acetitomaculum ruminis]SFA72815.1 16S rRNA (guanine966-N2)-methyltransferase [Acetitomaculum ruminis DSM 5522]
MRVIAGSARSMRLKTVEGLNTRPTTDRIKETLFNILNSEIYDCVFLDLFAGSGGIGIEALSRGAKKAYFIENNNKAINCIKENLIHTKLDNKASIIKADVMKGIYDIVDDLDLVFLDPPYKADFYKKTFESLSGLKYVHEDTLIIAEAQKDEDFDFLGEYGFEIVREKIYKTNKHVFVKRKLKE